MADWLWFLAGLVLVVDGSTVFVRSVVTLAKNLRLPKALVAGSAVAIGTSLPELSVTISSVLRHDASLAIGNIVGANISNMFLAMGLVLASGALLKNEQKLGLVANLLVIVTILFALLVGRGLKPWQGGGLLLLAGYLIYKESRTAQGGRPYKQQFNNLFLGVMAVMGLVALVYGAGQLTGQAEALASAVGISDFVVGLVVVAAGTTLPELAATMAALRQREATVAINALIGSNLFNITLIGGVGGLSGQFQHSFAWPTAIMFLGSSLVAAVVGRYQFKRMGGRALGLALLTAYIAHLTYLALAR
jgi:cation:H+ antiporter